MSWSNRIWPKLKIKKTFRKQCFFDDFCSILMVFHSFANSPEWTSVLLFGSFDTPGTPRGCVNSGVLLFCYSIHVFCRAVISIADTTNGIWSMTCIQILILTHPVCLFVCFKGGMGTGVCPGSLLCLTDMSIFAEIPKVVNSLWHTLICDEVLPAALTSQPNWILNAAKAAAVGGAIWPLSKALPLLWQLSL